MEIRNLTPHILNIVAADGTVVNIEPSGIVPRISSSQEIVEVINGINVSHEVLGDVIDLPAPEEGVVLVVSRLVASAVSGTRNDVLVPGALLRNDQGQVIGANGLARL